MKNFALGDKGRNRQNWPVVLYLMVPYVNSVRKGVKINGPVNAGVLTIGNVSCNSYK